MKYAENLTGTTKSTIIDVRTAAEFAGGHLTGSINIPLQELPDRLNELRGMKHLVICCASGNRSAQATRFLKQNDIACENGGPWTDLNCFN